MPKYIVTQGPIEHDGELCRDGDEIDCKAEAAQQLVDADVVVQKGRASRAPAESKD